MAKSENYCCPMRRHVLVGIVSTREDEEAPVEMADFIICWEPIVIRIKYCSFCGEEVPYDDTVRVGV